jgi:hypothetical protein
VRLQWSLRSTSVKNFIWRCKYFATLNMYDISNLGCVTVTAPSFRPRHLGEGGGEDEEEEEEEDEEEEEEDGEEEEAEAGKRSPPSVINSRNGCSRDHVHTYTRTHAQRDYSPFVPRMRRRAVRGQRSLFPFH